MDSKKTAFSFDWRFTRKKSDSKRKLYCLGGNSVQEAGSCVWHCCQCLWTQVRQQGTLDDSIVDD